jgi:hypothetical protein
MFLFPLVSKYSVIQLKFFSDFNVLIIFLLNLKTILYLKLPKFFFLFKDIRNNAIWCDIKRFYFSKHSFLQSRFKKMLLSRKCLVIKRLNTLFTHICYTNAQSLKLKGMGYKWWRLFRYIVLKVRFSHLAFLQLNPWVKAYIIDKYTLILQGFSTSVLNNAIQQFLSVFPADSYKGKGIRLWNTRLRLKVGKQMQM